MSLQLLTRYGLSKVASDGGPTTLASDTFTDTNGISLAAHTMDTGSGWTVSQGTLTIQANQLVGEAGGNVGVCDIGVSEFTASADLEPGCAIVVRYADSNDYIFANLNLSAQLMELTRMVSGVVTVLASRAVTLVAGTPYAVEVTVTSAGVSVTVDDGPVTSAVTSLNNTSTKAGVRIFNASRNVDNFLVTG